MYKCSWIVRELLDAGIDNIYVPYPLTRWKGYNLFDSNGFIEKHVYKVSKDKPFLGHLEIHVVDRCNLNCKACTHFSPISKKQCVSIESIKKDIQRISELFDNVLECWVLGGEPFLEPDLIGEVITEFRQHFPKTDLSVTTNGLLIPALKHNVFNVIKSCDATVMVSAYGPTADIINAIIKKLDSYHIRHKVSVSKNSFFVMKTESPSFNLEANNDRCHISEVVYLMNGKLSKCPESMLIKKFDEYFNTHIYQDEQIDIYKENDAWRIFNKLIEPISSCGYCNTENREFRPWEICGNKPPQKDYWLTDNKVGRISGYEEKLGKCSDAAEILDLYLSYQMKALDDYFVYRSDKKSMTYILYGVSSLGRIYSEILNKHEQSVVFCDDSTQAYEAVFEGFHIISPTELKKMYNPQTCKILITSNSFFEILAQLKNEGTISSLCDAMPLDGALNDLFAKAFERVI